jgi:hypothetical protein
MGDGVDGFGRGVSVDYGAMRRVSEDKRHPKSFKDGNGRVVSVGDRVRVRKRSKGGFWALCTGLVDNPDHGVIAEVFSDATGAEHSVPAVCVFRATHKKLAQHPAILKANAQLRSAIPSCKGRDFR